LINNHYDQPFIKESADRVIDNSHTIITFDFENFHRVENYLIIEFFKDLQIFDGSTEIVNIAVSNTDNKNNCIFYSEYGIAMNKDLDTFINANKINLIKILPTSLKTYKIRVLTTEINKLKIIPVSREVL